MNLENVKYDSKLYLRYKKNKLKIRTPVMRLPFGTEDYYGKTILKLEFTNIKNDLKMKVLHDAILELEKKNMEELGVSPDQYKSCIVKYKDHEPYIVVKIEMKYDRPNCQIVNNEEFLLKTIYEFKKNDKAICDIVFDRLWRYNNGTGCIVKLTKIICV